MCSHYQTLKDAEKLLGRFGAQAQLRIRRIWSVTSAC